MDRKHADGLLKESIKKIAEASVCLRKLNESESCRSRIVDDTEYSAQDLARMLGSVIDRIEAIQCELDVKLMRDNTQSDGRNVQIKITDRSTNPHPPSPNN
jgi:hypothetical protein